MKNKEMNGETDMGLSDGDVCGDAVLEEGTDGAASLPAEFAEKMQKLLGDEAEAFFGSYRETRRFGLRVNLLKLKDGLLPEYLSGLAPIPWSAEGYYYGQDMRPGKHPFHEAGLYYIQEPSAQACAEALNPAPGERILDLCAAPGGKSTHLAGKMNQKGLLVCNEIHPARAKILSQNVERMGIGNAVVTNMEPAGLVPVFREFFDGIVVDAPCSGEGMFRKDENARTEWSPDHVRMCAARQDGILDCAAKMVRAGGRIVYSTCTFSPEENEQTVARFLERHPEFCVERPEIAAYFAEGRPDWAGGGEEVRKTVRIWPHKVDGEGHFMALLVKAGAEDKGTEDGGETRSGKRTTGKADCRMKRGTKVQPDLKDFYSFCEENLTETEALLEGRRFLVFGDNLYLAPEGLLDLSGLRVLRPGLHVGTLKKGRLEPSHALALFLRKEDMLRWAEIGTGLTAEKYLRGETLTLEELKPFPENETLAEGGESLKGWTLVTTGGYSLGFAKADRGVLKNHYPKGLRRF